MEYKPPFEMNERIATLAAEIAELSGEISVYEGLTANPVLRRENRIKTIRSSLAIEQNTLSIKQVTDVIDGKRVLAPPADIKEVQNAYEIYEKLNKMDPYSMEDLLSAHRVMTKDLIKESGMFRSGNAGIYDGEKLIHAGTPSNYIPEVMKNLFKWLKESNLHPLIKSCLFHYEFEFIHPFSDGNGRTGRLWYTLILSKWKPFFAWVPIESLIHDHQQAYYDALGTSNETGSANDFVLFMLNIIKTALKDVIIRTRNVGDDVGDDVGDTGEQILNLLNNDPRMSALKVAENLGLSGRQVERIIKSLREEGRLVRHGANRGGYWEVKL